MSDSRFAFSAVTGDPVNFDWADEPVYYQQEFEKILDSGEAYRGRFNWWALLLGPLWGFARGLHLSSFVWLAAAVLTGGWATPFLWAYNIYFGVRGNYMRYAAIAKRRQVLIGD